jgi:hypothetical protein
MIEGRMLSLEELVAGTLPLLPTDEDTKFTLNQANCPPAPEEVETSGLKVLKSFHDYGEAVRYDVVHLFADKPTYRALGIIVFTAIFHSRPHP